MKPTTRPIFLTLPSSQAHYGRSDVILELMRRPDFDIHACRADGGARAIAGRAGHHRAAHLCHLAGRDGTTPLHCANGQWSALTLTAEAEEAEVYKRLSAVTFNVWFDAAHKRQRWDALLEQVLECNADVVALQEMTGDTWRWLMSDARVQSTYALSASSPHSSYFVVLMWRKMRLACRRARVLPYRVTKHGRALLAAELLVNGRVLCVGCVHLESPVYGGSAGVRAEQLALSYQLLHSCTTAQEANDSLLLGDFNFCSTSEDVHILEGGHIDVCRAVLGAAADHDLTFDVDHNGNVDGPYRCRPDRITMKTGAWRAVSIRRLGCDPIPTIGVPPSDHFGLWAVFEYEKE